MVDLKKITRRGAIGLGLAAIVLAGATVVNNLMPVNRNPLEDPAAVKVVLKARRKVLYNAIVGYNEEFYGGTKSYGGDFEGYVDFMAQGSLWQGYSNEVRKNIDFYTKKNNGDKEEGKKVVVDGYVNVQKKCLDVAVYRLDSEVSEQDIDECAKGLVRHMSDMAGETTPIDYQHPAVKEAYKTFAKQRVNFFRNIMINSGLTRNSGLSKEMQEIRKMLDESRNVEDVEGRSEIFKKVVKSLCTKEEFEQEILDYEKARKPLYASFGKSLENHRGALSFFIRMFGPIIAVRTGERSDEINRKEVGRIFQQDANDN
ncbi:MAG: hypothetical protein ABH840_01240 [Nanoarchaeota archaeon]